MINFAIVMSKITRRILIAILLLSSFPAVAQINTDQVLRIGRNNLYFEDYVLSIQYFNQVINVKPHLAQPYFLRAIAKLNLDDFQGAETMPLLPLSATHSSPMHGKCVVWPDKTSEKTETQ